MKATELLEKVFLDLKITKRRSEKVKKNILKRSVAKRGLSLVHEDHLKSMPKDEGIFTKAFRFHPASSQTEAGKRMRKGIITDLNKDQNTKQIKEKIGKKDIEVLILYKLVNIKKKRDIDNYTKNLLDSLKGYLFEDDCQVKFLASKIEYIKTKNKKYNKTLEKAIIRIDFMKNSELSTHFNKIFNSGNKYNDILSK